jgi:hypothetical protein
METGSTKGTVTHNSSDSTQFWQRTAVIGSRKAKIDMYGHNRFQISKAKIGETGEVNGTKKERYGKTIPNFY